MLSKAISIISILFAAFGGIIIQIQPPGISGIESGFIATFSALVILLIIAGVTSHKKVKMRGIWIVSSIISFSCFIIFSIFYFQYKHDYVVNFPQGSDDYYIVGDSLDYSGLIIREYLITNSIPINNISYIENGEGPENINNIWTKVSIDKISNNLNIKYVLVMVFLSISIFSIIEGIFQFLSKERNSKPFE